jgi:hypothetical protein
MFVRATHEVESDPWVDDQWSKLQHSDTRCVFDCDSGDDLVCQSLHRYDRSREAHVRPLWSMRKLKCGSIILEKDDAGKCTYVQVYTSIRVMRLTHVTALEELLANIPAVCPLFQTPIDWSREDRDFESFSKTRHPSTESTTQKVCVSCLVISSSIR